MKLLLEYEEEFCRRYYQTDYIFVNFCLEKPKVHVLNSVFRNANNKAKF